MTLTHSDAGGQARDDTARRNLLLSFPELDVAHDGRDVVDALVEGAVCHILSTNGVDKMLILSDVSGTLRSLTGLTYEPAELVSAFERLGRRGRLSFRDESHRSFVYDETAFRATADALGQRMAASEAVRVAWVDEVRQRHGLDGGQAEGLWSALDTFATELINAYSAEAAAFLYLQDAKGKALFEEALQAKLPDIKDRAPADVADIAQAEFPRFFDPTNAARTDYLVGRLRAGFFFHLLSVDPMASRLVRDQVSGKTLYLDSNFVFRLIGFHGPMLAFTPLTTVEISTLLQCKLLVARETVDEVVRVIRANSNALRAAPITRETYLRVAAEHPSEEGAFMAAYYREYHSGLVKSPADFARKWSNVRAFLAQWGIEVDEDAYASDAERNSPEFLDDISRLQQWHSGQKSPAAVEHDVAMLRIVRERRGRVDATSAEIRVWFLTFDRQLTRYSARNATDEHLPVALIADDWLQIARPFLPRTDDYAKSFVAMLRTPMLYQGSNKVPFSHMAEALSRLERYQELPEQVVAAMVADDQFTRRFLEAKSEEAARNVVELKVGSLAADTIVQNESLQDQLESVQLQLSVVRDNVDSLRVDRDAAATERDRALREAEQAGRQAERRIQEYAEELRTEFDRKLSTAVAKAKEAGAADMKQELQPDIQARISAARRWTAYFCLCGAATVYGCAALALRWNAWTGMQRAVVTTAVVMVWPLLLWIPKSLNTAFGVASGLASLIGLGAWAHDAWTKAEERSPAQVMAPRPSLSGTSGTPPAAPPTPNGGPGKRPSTPDGDLHRE